MFCKGCEMLRCKIKNLASPGQPDNEIVNDTRYKNSTISLALRQQGVNNNPEIFIRRSITVIPTLFRLELHIKTNGECGMNIHKVEFSSLL